MFSQHSKYYVKVFLVLLYILGINQKVINKDYYKLIQIFIEYDVYYTHKVCGCIGQPEWHHYKLVVPVPLMKGGLGNIFISDPQLMVPRSQVNLQKYFGSSYLIKQIIDPREWVTILSSHFVQLTVINAHPHRTVLLYK